MAFVLSSVSGNLISAASAGYAPTNSGDVSAIASAYQVVSATATQLYAGTAYLTSVNGAPVSASRAGNAANASLANSAWYDGTGRFISSLPDSATVSAIASAYTTGKQDTLAFAYNTADQISSINGSALGGMDEAAVSGIASAYAESAASGCIPTSMSSDFQPVTGMSSYVPYSSIGYNTASAISGINGSALAGTTYSAGTGIDITDDMISVEAPVDIVAGPGIVIDNPDGNTLRVSVAQADETVLWSGTKYWWNDTSNLSLSEAASNFEVIRVKAKDDWELPHKFIFFPGENAGFDVSLIGCEGGTLAIKASKFSVSGSTVSLAAKFRWQVGSDKTVSVGTDTSFIQFSEIVGIHRLANN